MKYIGIDYGLKRIGLAISEGSFAFPKGIIQNKKAIEKIVEIIKSSYVDGIVIGSSVSTNGQENEISEDIKKFAQKLKEKSKLKVFFQNEDFSSVEAHRYQVKKGARDDSAAAIILQRFLDKKNVQQ